MPPDAVGILVRAVNHRDRVPSNDATDALLDPRVPRIFALFIRWNRIDIIRRQLALGDDSFPARRLQETLEHVARPARARRLDDGLQGFDPLSGLDGVCVLGFGLKRVHSGALLWPSGVAPA